MLQLLTLHNFQKHQKLVITLSPITTVVGPTDVGKSSIIRSLVWLTLNQPDGKSFISKGKKWAKVILQVDSQSVVRKRGTTSNFYKLDDQLLKVPGRGTVPDPVANLLNLSRSNFVLQHDGPTWFSASAGKVSQQLNKIVNLDQIDQTLANLASEVRKAKTVVSVSKDRLQQAKSRRDELEWVMQADEELLQIEKKQKQLEDLDQQSKALSALIRTLEIQEAKVKQELPSKQEMEYITNKRDKLADLNDQILGLEQLLGEYQREQHNINKYQELANQTEQLIQQKMGKRCPLCQRPMS